jgi:pyruvate dehydrogenase E2 component (dihydrolipoamide acetyltransferase)
VTDVVAIAAARALKGHPTCNARIRDGRPEGYLVPRIGILIRPGDALIPLVFDDPSGEDASTFHARRKHAQEAAAQGRIAAANAGSPTFVISNLGTHAVHWFAAMLYPDTALTLALGALGTGGRGPAELAIVLTCDHRLADGVEAAQFMESLRGAILGVPISAEGNK